MGEWVGAKSGKTFDVTNPATDQVLAKVPHIYDMHCSAQYFNVFS